MRNIRLILLREYLERVRTRSFLVSTLLFPGVVIALIVVPGRMVMLKSSAARKIVVVAPTQELAQAVKTELETRATRAGDLGDPAADPSSPGIAQPASYQVQLDANASEQERARLNSLVASGAIDGYLLLPNEINTAREARYYSRETSDYLQQSELGRAVSRALLRSELDKHGMSSEQVSGLLAPVQLQTVGLRDGKESPSSGLAQFLSVIILIVLLYFTLVVYGVAVMRSVVEEKSSRVMEVMLSTATPRQMMAGKLLGVGAVGLTQILIWTVVGAFFTLPGLLVLGGPSELNFPLALVPAFAVSFVLGYLLYSAMFAALGAMVNSDQEASQYQLIVTLPLIVPMILLNFVIREPSAPLSVWMSMVPLFSPVLMYVRMVTQTPPAWQVALSLAILLATIYAVLVVCSRIYRVGILMYGKKPSLAEVWKWMRYA